jgi:hypothetical protein
MLEAEEDGEWVHAGPRLAQREGCRDVNVMYFVLARMCLAADSFSDIRLLTGCMCVRVMRAGRCV